MLRGSCRPRGKEEYCSRLREEGGRGEYIKGEIKRGAPVVMVSDYELFGS